MQTLRACLLVALFGAELLSSVAGEARDLGDINHERKLLKYLKEGLDPMVRPAINNSEPIDVKLTFAPLYFKGIDEPNQEFMIYAWFNMEWNDPQLVWDPSEYGGINETRIKADELWTPDIGIVNSAVHFYKDIVEPDKYRVEVTYDGNAYLGYSGDIRTICLLDDTYFPFDHQMCHVEFDCWTNGMKHVYFTNSSTLATTLLRSNGLWDVKDTSIVYTRHPNPLVDRYRTASFVFK